MQVGECREVRQRSVLVWEVWVCTEQRRPIDPCKPMPPRPRGQEIVNNEKLVGFIMFTFICRALAHKLFDTPTNTRLAAPSP